MAKQCNVSGVILPLLLLILAALAAGLVSYGVHPFWGRFHAGIELIVFSRRLQWPLVALAIICCLVLIVLVIAAKRRAWWLIGLAPIVAILAHHFDVDPSHAFAINDNPIFVAPDQANFLNDDDWVVGIVDHDDSAAYPFAALYADPVVVQAQQETPLMLMWSAFANRAVAVHIDRSTKARELEIVSMPANSLLIYNSRLGQFINGITGLTLDGRKPDGLDDFVPTRKTTWLVWRTLHPRTRVLVPPSTTFQTPHRPILPYYPMPQSAASAPGKTIAFIPTTRPVAVMDDDIGAEPVNFSEPSIVFMRDPATGIANAFERTVDTDLFPAFRAGVPKKHRPAVMIDSDSGSFWTADGRAIAGPMKGKKLNPIELDDGVNYDVLRLWYPQLRVLTPLASEPQK